MNVGFKTRGEGEDYQVEALRLSWIVSGKK